MVEEILVRKQEANIRQQEISLRIALEAEMNLAQSVPDAGMFAAALSKAEALNRTGVLNLTHHHNLNVSNSVVGAVNSGTIQKLNVKIEDLQKKQETAEVAKALQELKDAILKSKHLPEGSRREAADQLTYLAGQAAQPEEQREHGVVKVTLYGLHRLLSVTADVLQVWNQWGPAVLAYFRF